VFLDERENIGDVIARINDNPLARGLVTDD
jgi:hypothetical protein